jgi:hypothetical protein
MQFAVYVNSHRRKQFASTYYGGSLRVATSSAVVAENRFQCIILIFACQLEHVDQCMIGH